MDAMPRLTECIFCGAIDVPLLHRCRKLTHPERVKTVDTGPMHFEWVPYIHGVPGTGRLVLKEGRP